MKTSATLTRKVVPAGIVSRLQSVDVVGSALRGSPKTIVALIALLFLVTLAGCANQRPAAASAKAKVYVVVPPSITWSNVAGTIIVWTNGALWKSYVVAPPPGPAQWTAPTNAWPASNAVSFYQQSVTPTVVSFTVFSGLPGQRVYELQRTQDLENWQPVLSQDSPQTNSAMSFLMVDEAPVINGRAWYRIVTE